jgi:hypothetical protein
VVTGDKTPDPAAPPRPVTCHDAQDQYGPGIYQARERFEELTGRDVLARAITELKARGTFDPARHPDPAGYPPLTVEERLELLALGELLARYYTHPSRVHAAVRAGASWAQVAGARGTDEVTARRGYRAWDRTGKFGLDDAGHAAAVARAGTGREAPAGGGLVKLPPGAVVLTAGQAAAVAAALKDAVPQIRKLYGPDQPCRACEDDPAGLCSRCAAGEELAADYDQLAGLLTRQASPYTGQGHQASGSRNSGEMPSHARPMRAGSSAGPLRDGLTGERASGGVRGDCSDG